MAKKILMPRLSLTMKEGTVIRWYKKEGESVEKGEPLVEVLSEKVTYDIEAPESGVLRKILAEEGKEVPVNGILGIVGAPDELLLETEETVKPVPAEIPTRKVEKRVLASPAARRLAREYGVDLERIRGTGPEGRIVERDVERFIQKQMMFTPRIKEVIPLTGLRKTVAERVSFSFKTAPHITINMEVDMSNVVALHKKLEGVSYTDMLVKAVAKALRKHPLLNSALEEGQIKVFEDINVGVAVAVENGLVVPVVHNADKKSLLEIASQLKELVEKAKKARLEKKELTGGTFTITNLGMYDVDFFTPIINPPETAILGVGKILEKPVVVDNRVVVKPMLTLSLSFDHRVVDGAPAARFLQEVKRTLESASL